MTLLRTQAGATLKTQGGGLLQGTLPLFHDDFHRSDGAVGNGWSDFATTLPSNFDPVTVSGNLMSMSVPSTATTLGHADTSFGTPPASHMGHTAAYRSLGYTDNLELSTRWYMDHILSINHQVSPAGYLSPLGNTFEMGLSNLWDIGLNRFYCCAVFSSTQGSILWPYYYYIYDSNIPVTGFVSGTNVVTIRFVGGKMEGLLNGERLWGPVDVPAWALGRDAWGTHVVQIAADIGSTDGLGQPVTGFHPALISEWWAREYTTPLSAYPTSVTPTSIGTTAKAASSGSVNVPYPSSIAAGDKLIAIVCTSNSGNISTPSGWSVQKSQRVSTSGTFGIWWFEKTATGSETGNLTFSKASGTGDNGGVMFTVKHHHPNHAVGFPSSQGNSSASTTLGAPSQNYRGPNRTIIWIGGTGGNTAVTIPSGYTEIAQLGTSGAAVNFSVAWYSNYPFTGGYPGPSMPSTGPIDGSLAASVTSVGMTSVAEQDPR